ncbi:hypothetical protein BH23CHL2_BH23CHL2_33770 [soil metagenome]
MNQHERLQGQGVIETRQETTIPVYYHLLIEHEATDDGEERTIISGRLSISGDPWLESSVIEDGRILVIRDGRRLHVRMEPAGRGSTSLPFRAEFANQDSIS